MAKRGASYQLTDQNWNNEEESEDAGVFKAADEDALKKRQIKTAKRRGPASGEGGSSGAFKGFVGFGAKTSPSAAAPAFSFGTKGLPGLGASSNGEKPAAGGFIFGSAASKDPAKTESDAPKTAAGFKFTSSSTSAVTKTTSTSGFSFGSSETNSKPLFGFGVKSSESKEATKPLASTVVFGSSVKSTGASEPKLETSPKKNGSSSNPKYLAQLKGLNEAVAKWIKNHVDENPYILLTPIFKDYEKYLEQIEKENPEKSSDDKKSTSPSTEIVSTDFSFGASKAKSPDSSDKPKEDNSTKASPIAFGTSTGSTGSTALTSGFSFKPANTTSTASGFSFKASDSTSGSMATPFSFKASDSTSGSTATPFSFKASDSTSGSTATPFTFATSAPAAAPAPAAAAAAETGGDEEYVPPKPETVEIKEDDAFYTKRCKMFFQKEGKWTERGVGNIYLKPLNDKTQLLIRADNTLGTVLLNIVLSSAIPTKRQGKNNVSLICTPNPPIDPKADDNKPASLLIRVKTSQDADELLGQLEKHKS